MVNDPEVDVDGLCELARQICLRFHVSVADVSLVIADDEGIRPIHKRFLDSASVTDVISFDLTEEDKTPSFEVIINVQEAARQAKMRGHRTTAELALYVTHGLLHQFGFDDADEPSAGEMHRMEDEILLQAGFGTVYNTPSRDQDE